MSNMEKKSGFSLKGEVNSGQTEREALSKDVIREVFIAHGFTVKEGQTDLKQYVYDAAHALLARAAATATATDGDPWWIESLRALWGDGTCDLDTRRAAKVACDTFERAAAPQGLIQNLAATVQRRIDACCVAANTPGADYFDASTNLVIASRELLSALATQSPAPASPSGEDAANVAIGEREAWLEDLKRIAHELRTYNPAADEYKGEHIHKVWAREIEALLPAAPNGESK